MSQRKAKYNITLYHWRNDIYFWAYEINVRTSIKHNYREEIKLLPLFDIIIIDRFSQKVEAKLMNDRQYW